MEKRLPTEPLALRLHIIIVSFLSPELMCAVGYGVAALFASTDKTWGLANYSLTAVRTLLSLSPKTLFPPVVPFSHSRSRGMQCVIG